MTNSYGYEIPVCTECERLMMDYSKPSDPFFICATCGGTDQGVEADWCECGSPRDPNGACRDGCQEGDSECENCGEFTWQAHGECTNCGYMGDDGEDE